MEQINRRRADTRELVKAGVLAALIIVMTVTPYTGYIYYGLIEITTLHIIVAAGAVMLGWKYGAFLGLVWGVTCVLRALTNPLWAPFVNPLVSVVPRVLVGIVAGLVSEWMTKARCRPTVTAAVSAAAATVTNTVLVLTALKLFSAVLTGAPLLGTIYGTLIGVNGVIELVAAILLTPVIVMAVRPRELVLGVDLGTSAVKLALVKNGRCIKTQLAENDVPLAETLAAFGTSGVKRVAVTGVGASFLKENLCGVPTAHVDEFLALSRGAAHISRKHNCLVVSIGTGTSFTRVTPVRAWHVGGSGVGGGMLKGLSARLCDTGDMRELQALASEGDLHNIDLELQDVCAGTLSNLQPTSTVANMAKLGDAPSRADIAAGLCNMIFQSIGVMAAFAVKKHVTRTIVLVGTIMDWPIAKRSFDEVAPLHNVKFITPENAAFATAIGAAIK